MSPTGGGKIKISRGFTLIEILLVVIIIGIILAIAAPNFSKSYSHFQLDKTSGDLTSISRWAQAMAIGQQRIYALSFSDDRRSYNLVRAKIDKDTGLQDGFEAVNGSLGRMHVVPAGIQIDTDQARIGFYPDGTIDPAKIQLNSSTQKTTLSSTVIRGMMTRENNE